MSIQFTIPRRVASVLDVAAVRARARAAGVPYPSLEMNDKDAGPSKTRITCSEPMAIALLEEIRVHTAAAETRNDLDTLIACAEAVKAAFDAIDKARGISRDPSPAKGIGKAMG